MRAGLLVILGWCMAGQAWGVGAMGMDDARHLLLRTGFAPTLEQLQRTSVLDHETAVDQLLNTVHREAKTPIPAGVDVLMDVKRREALRNNTATEAERRQFVREQIETGLNLRSWWLREMLETDSPLTERMTLFWHNHFVSSMQKVKSSALMLRQNQTLRRHALGNFRELLHAVAKDPAMVVYLDNVSNRKGQPNENFAREVMELFTLGEGHYSEHDIKEAARAFTGWSLDRSAGSFRYYRVLHDNGEKTVLGRTGRLTGEDVLDVLLAQPATAEFITAKLWREFISPQPDHAAVQRIAGLFRASGYDIKTVMRALLTSEHFYASANRAILIKSPVELVVGTLRQFDMHPADLRAVAFSTRQLGQDLFAPPNVKGWPGGEAWINSTSLLARRQLLARLFRGEEMPMAAPQRAAGDGARAERYRQNMMRSGGYEFQSMRWSGQFNGDSAARQLQMQRLVLASAPAEPLPQGTDMLSFIGAMVLDPVYQLK